MNELEKAYNGIEDAIGSLDYEGNYDVDTPRESLEYIKIYINNLQSKLNKAIDKINQYELIVGYYDSNYDEYDDTYSHDIKDELSDIFKEDK